MLVLSRKRDESIVIDNGKITITVIEIRGDKVRLGIEADKSITVNRKEVYEAIQREQKQAAGPTHTIYPPSPPKEDHGQSQIQRSD